MKTSVLRTLAVALSAASLVLLPSCNNNDEPDSEKLIDVTADTGSLSYDDDGIWSENNLDVNLVLGDFTFSHYLTEWMTVEGFTPSRSTDNAFHQPMYEWLYTVVPGHGLDGRPFISAFWSSREGESFGEKSCSIARTDGDVFSPESIMVVNSCYAYYSMIQGDTYCKKFEKGDWFRLTAHGVKEDGSETVAEFYLAKITDDNDIEKGIVTDWTRFDLNTLGDVTGIYFTLDSSDSGQWGMNTPASFAVTDFTVKTKTSSQK